MFILQDMSPADDSMQRNLQFWKVYHKSSFRGKHRAVSCIGCHLWHPQTATKALQSCNRCHLTKKKAHFKLDGCRSCRKNPHKPPNISFSDIRGNCVSCHAVQVAMLKKAKHATFACAFCHKEKHRMVPKCQDRHRIPHPEGFMKKFPTCGECHNMAHDLNHRTAAPSRRNGRRRHRKKK